MSSGTIISIKKILQGTNIKPGDLVEVIPEKNKIVLKTIKKDKPARVIEKVADKWKNRPDALIAATAMGHAAVLATESSSRTVGIRNNIHYTGYIQPCPTRDAGRSRYQIVIAPLCDVVRHTGRYHTCCSNHMIIIPLHYDFTII